MTKNTIKKIPEDEVPLELLSPRPDEPLPEPPVMVLLAEGPKIGFIIPRSLITETQKSKNYLFCFLSNNDQ